MDFGPESGGGATALAEALAQLRHAAGSPSYPLLESLGSPPRSTVSDWLTGKSVPREIDQLLRLVSAVARVAPGLPPDVLDDRRWRMLLSGARVPEKYGRPLPGPVLERRGARCAEHAPDDDEARPLPAHWVGHVDWFLGEIRADVNPRICVVGAVDSGKSTFFQLLTDHQPHRDQDIHYAYWRLTESLGAETEAGFWAVVLDRLGLGGIGEPQTAVRCLPQLLAEAYGDGQPHTVVLVLDDWDYAQAHPEFVDTASLRRARPLGGTATR